MLCNVGTAVTATLPIRMATDASFLLQHLLHQRPPDIVSSPETFVLQLGPFWQQKSHLQAAFGCSVVDERRELRRTQLLLKPAKELLFLAPLHYFRALLRFLLLPRKKKANVMLLCERLECITVCLSVFHRQ